MTSVLTTINSQALRKKFSDLPDMSTSTTDGYPAAPTLTEHRGFALLSKLGTACKKKKVSQNIQQCKVKGSKAELEKLITDIVIKSGVLQEFDFEESREGTVMMNNALRHWLMLAGSSAEDKVNKHFATLSLLEQLPPTVPGSLTSILKEDTNSQEEPRQPSKDSVQFNLTDAETDLTDGGESLEEFVRESSTDTRASEKAEVPSKEEMPTGKFTFDDAMELLTELREAYLAEEFKEEKASIDSLYTVEIEDDYLDDVGHMVMRVLHFIFPKYGFAKNLKGAAQFKLAMCKLLIELAEKENADSHTLQQGLSKFDTMMPLYNWIRAIYDEDPDYHFLRLPQVPMNPNRKKERRMYENSIIVAQKKVGAIIGKQSESRRQIEVQSGARLTFEDYSSNGQYQTITAVCDSPKGVKMAIDLIKERIEKNGEEDEKPEPTKEYTYRVALKNFGAKEDKIKIKIDAVKVPTVAVIKQAVAEKLGCVSFSELEVVFDMFNGKFVKKLDTEEITGGLVLVRKVEALAVVPVNEKPSQLKQLTKMIVSVSDALGLV